MGVISSKRDSVDIVATTTITSTHHQPWGISALFNKNADTLNEDNLSASSRGDSTIVTNAVEKDEILSEGNYVDPPMPKMGKPVDVHKLIERNRDGQFLCENLMKTVVKYSKASIDEAKIVPIEESAQRIAVTKVISNQMSKKRSLKQNRDNRTANIHCIQQALVIRKDMIALMNTNYSGVKVGAIVAIDIGESRTQVVHHDGDEGDESDGNLSD